MYVSFCTVDVRILHLGKQSNFTSAFVCVCVIVSHQKDSQRLRFCAVDFSLSLCVCFNGWNKYSFTSQDFFSRSEMSASLDLYFFLFIIINCDLKKMLNIIYL